MTTEHPQKRDLFRRDPGGCFDDYRLETYAKARAKGGSIASAGVATGVSKETAKRWEQHPEMRARLRELRDGAEDFIGVSKAYVLRELQKNVELAREQNAIKSSNEALHLIYRIISEDNNVAHQMAAAKQLPTTGAGQDLQRRLKAAFSTPRLSEAARPEPEPATIDVTPEPDAESAP